MRGCWPWPWPCAVRGACRLITSHLKLLPYSYYVLPYDLITHFSSQLSWIFLTNQIFKMICFHVLLLNNSTICFYSFSNILLTNKIQNGCCSSLSIYSLDGSPLWWRNLRWVQYSDYLLRTKIGYTLCPLCTVCPTYHCCASPTYFVTEDIALPNYIQWDCLLSWDLKDRQVVELCVVFMLFIRL